MEADNIKALEPESSEFEDGFYTALGIPKSNMFESRTLKQIEEDFNILNFALSEAGKELFIAKKDQVVRRQEQLKALSEKYDVLYLLEGNYDVELSEKDVKYIGIGKSETNITLIGKTYCKKDYVTLFEHCIINNRELYDKEIRETQEQFSNRILDFLKNKPEGTLLPDSILSVAKDLELRGFNTEKIEKEVRKVLSNAVLEIKKVYYPNWLVGAQRGAFKKGDLVTLIYERQVFKNEGYIISMKYKGHFVEEIKETNQDSEIIVAYEKGSDFNHSENPKYLVKGNKITIGHGEMDINTIQGRELLGVVKEGFFSKGENVSVIYKDKTVSRAKILAITNQERPEMADIRKGDRASVIISTDKSIALVDIIGLKKCSEWTEPMKV